MRETPEEPGQMFDAMKAHAKTTGEWRGAMETKKKTEPTPGPWSYRLRIGMGSRPPYYEINHGERHEVIGETEVAQLADARLIAAAPDLLKAAKEMLAAVPNTDGEWAAALSLKAAIAKAEGEDR